MRLAIEVWQTDPPATCVPAQVIGKLWDLGKLSAFAAAFPNARGRVDDKANCHEVSSLLLTEVAAAGEGDGWRVATGICRFKGSIVVVHSWVEADGWAIDASKARCWVAPLDVFLDEVEASEVARFDVSRSPKWQMAVDDRCDQIGEES